MGKVPRQLTTFSGFSSTVLKIYCNKDIVSKNIETKPGSIIFLEILSNKKCQTMILQTSAITQTKQGNKLIQKLKVI